MKRIALGTLCVAAGLLVGPIAVAAPKRVLVVERAVLVMRHGIRAPLDGEVPPDTRTGVLWSRLRLTTAPAGCARTA
jgi:4-phytase/acid phosphatase